MDLVVEGYSSRQIAEKLGISPRTVETYRLAIMDTMGAGSVAALVRMAVALQKDPFSTAPNIYAPKS
jgi:FixJ family two-component response regulator